MSTAVRHLNADDTQVFLVLRREVTAQNRVSMGLSCDEELTFEGTGRAPEALCPGGRYHDGVHMTVQCHPLPRAA